MAVLAQVARGADDHVDAVHARLDRHARVVHVAADVREDLGVEPEPADGLAVQPALLRGRGARQLDVVDPELVQRPRDLDLLLRVEEGVGELLALSQRALDDPARGLSR